MTTTCPRCLRVFASYRALGQHDRHARAAKAKGRLDRLCPDRRDTDEVREMQLRIVRLRARLGLLGLHP